LFIFRPFPFNGYGRSGYLCWIQISDIDPTTRNFLLLFCLFLFLWVAMLYNTIMILKVFLFYKDHLNLLSHYDRHLKRIVWFPIAMLICWITPSIYRVFQMCGYENFWASLIHGISSGINGFVNTLIYAFNKKFREEVKTSFLSFSSNNNNFIRHIWI